MEEYRLIYIATNSVTILGDWILATLIMSLMIKRPKLFPHMWMAYPVLICIFTTSALHACYIAALFKFWTIRHLLLMLCSIDAMACTLAVLAGIIAYRELLTSPSIQDMKQTNDALASQLGCIIRDKT